jgi:hypothetical protein
MPGLIRGVARTAAIAGTASAVSNRVSRRQTQRWAEQDATAAPAPAAPPQAAAGGIVPNTVEQLKQLGQLHEQGVLTDEEFAAQKAKVLGS